MGEGEAKTGREEGKGQGRAGSELEPGRPTDRPNRCLTFVLSLTPLSSYRTRHSPHLTPTLALSLISTSLSPSASPHPSRPAPHRFKIRCSRYLYTLSISDPEKAAKLLQSLPPGLAVEEIGKNGAAKSKK